MVLGELPPGYLIYEIDRLKRELRDPLYVLDCEDADISAELKAMVERANFSLM